MEWGILILFAILAAALVATGPLEFNAVGADPGALHEARERLLRELRDLDEDAAAGRISAAERQEGRLAIAPQLRLVTEQLRSAGETPSPARGRRDVA